MRHLTAAEDEQSRDLVAADISRRLATDFLDPIEVLSSVLADLSRLGPGTWVGSVVNRDARTAEIRAASSNNRAAARYLEDLHSSGQAVAGKIAARVVDTGQPVVRTAVPRDEFMALLGADVRAYVAAHPVPVPTGLPVVSCVVVPMRSRGAVVGTLGLYRLSETEERPGIDLSWIQEIADRTGVAIENAQLYYDAAVRFERLAALNSVSLAVASTTDLHATLHLILDQVRKGLRADATDLLAVDESGAELFTVAMLGFRSAALPNLRIPVEGTLAGRIFAGRRMEVRSGSQLLESTRRTVYAREGFRTYGCAPLIARGRALGVLEVFLRSVVQVDPEWTSFLESVAAFAAVAIDSTRLSERLEKASTASAKGAPGGPRLSPLERQILELVVEGTTNADIARSVHLSQSTVKFHVRQILQRVGAANRTELARKATREGWL